MFTNFGKFILEGGLPVWGLVLMGLVGVAFILERCHSLYIKYAIDAEMFIKQIRSYVIAGKIEEGIAYCTQQGTALLPKIVKAILERSDRDEDQIFAAYELAASDVVPVITKRLGHLAMIANVATLIGLLGTIHGLIASFEAVSFADPVQKQTLLAQGISLSMNTTALGLVVAIPVMIMYSVLQAQQNKLLEDIIGQSKKIVDLLLSRNYVSYDEGTAFPGGENASGPKGMPAAPGKRKVA